MRDRELRMFPRVPVHLVVHYEDAEHLRSSVVQSISNGGVFIKTSRPLPIGTELVMEIKVDDGDEAPIRINGKVVWERLVGRDDGMGVQFLGEPPERLKKLLTPRVS